MADARFDFAFSIRIFDAAGHSDSAVVREHVAVKRIQRGVVNVGSENAFPQIVEHNHPGHPAEPAESFFMQLCPGT